MGLDTTHDCWHGPYSAFMRWRRRLAETIRIDLMQMQNYAPLGGKPWPSKKEEPLVILLDHSDCDGEISPEDAVPLADRLESLIPFLDAGDGQPGRAAEYSDRGRAEQFIEGLRAAAAAHESVVFH